MLKYALLELVRYRPLTGYELKKRFSGSVVFFWHATQTQIYRELKRLEKGGLIESRTELQVGRPARTVYSITDAGHAALMAWLRQPATLPRLKDPMLLKVFAFGLLSPEEALEHLQATRELHQARLADFLAVRQNLEARFGAPEDASRVDGDLFWRFMTLAQAMLHEEMYIAWCRWVVEHYAARTAKARNATNAERSPRPPEPVAAVRAVEGTGDTYAS